MLGLLKDQINDIPFVLVDNLGTEVPGLGGGFNTWVRKAGGAFAGATGVQAELGNGWYVYTATAGECDTDGSLALRVTGVGAVQQNLSYTVGDPATASSIAGYLMSSMPTLTNVLRSTDLNLYRGDTWTQILSRLGDLTGYTDIWFGIKEDPEDNDSQAIVLISNSIGLERINGAVATVPANGSITVLDAASGIIQIDLDEVETAKLAPDKRFWDCQWLISGTVTTPKAGRIAVIADVVRATA